MRHGITTNAAAGRSSSPTHEKTGFVQRDLRVGVFDMSFPRMNPRAVVFRLDVLYIFPMTCAIAALVGTRPAAGLLRSPRITHASAESWIALLWMSCADALEDITVDCVDGFITSALLGQIFEQTSSGAVASQVVIACVNYQLQIFTFLLLTRVGPGLSQHRRIVVLAVLRSTSLRCVRCLPRQRRMP